MRRFSQRNPLVTLSDINITPLLDLAFVLLIIFVITTPLLEQSINLNLPRGGQADKRIDKHDIRTVEISNNGTIALDKQRMRSIDLLIAQLAREFKANPNLIVYIRADQDGPYKNVAAVIDGCLRSGITRYSLRTDPSSK
jgi:biopolymer transport protein ExbD